MGRGKEDSKHPRRKLDRREGDGYPQEHEAGRVFSEVQGSRETRSGAAGTSSVPTLDDLKELNRAIHEDAGQPPLYALDQPAPLIGVIEQARDEYGPAPEAIIKVAGILAHGIARAQSFRDGNRRTAYITTKSFLDENGLGGLGPTGKHDHMLTRYLNQVVDNPRKGGPVPGPEVFSQLFMRRFQKWSR